MDLPGLTDALDRTLSVGGNRVLYRFQYKVKGRTHAFDSVLTCDGPPPWGWVIAHVGTGLWAHTFEVEFKRGGRERVLWTNPYLGDDYDQLVRLIFGLDGSGGPWPAAALLQSADTAAWSAKARSWVPPHQLPARMRRDVVEADKCAFLGWRTWPDKNGKDGPRPENLHKTRTLLGIEVAQVCQSEHISSCWTTPDDPRLTHYDHRPDPLKWLSKRQRS